MHASPSESSVLRALLEKAEADKKLAQTKLEDVLSDLDVECDVSSNRTWVDTYYCGTHGTHFRDPKGTYICPVGHFAKSIREKYEQTT